MFASVGINTLYSICLFNKPYASNLLGNFVCLFHECIFCHRPSSRVARTFDLPVIKILVQQHIWDNILPSGVVSTIECILRSVDSQSDRIDLSRWRKLVWTTLPTQWTSVEGWWNSRIDSSPLRIISRWSSDVGNVLIMLASRDEITCSSLDLTGREAINLHPGTRDTGPCAVWRSYHTKSFVIIVIR